MYIEKNIFWLWCESRRKRRDNLSRSHILPFIQLMCVTCPIHVHYVTHSYVSHDLFLFRCHAYCRWYLLYVCHNSTWCVTWLIHMCETTHGNTHYNTRCNTHCNTNCMAVSRVEHMCDMTHTYVWHDSYICVRLLIHPCAMTHVHVWRDPCTSLCHAYCRWYLSYVWYDPSISVTWPNHTISRLLRMIGLFRRI